MIGVAAAVVAGLLTGCAQAAAAPAPAPAAVRGLPPASSAPVAPTASPVLARPAAGAWLSVPSIGVRGLTLVAYTGHADDAAGTRIEDRGLAASPRGSAGGVAPGQVGNLIVTGHRTAAGGPLLRLPALRDGAHVYVTVGTLVYDYVVTGTMTISFRRPSSLALQSAAVPGHPGQPATRAMITLSTCATMEDHAKGDYWHDALGNPEHRIDKVGVLVAVRAA